MMKFEVASRIFYQENPLTAGHSVKGTQISMVALERGGPCLIGDSHVEWDEANHNNVHPFNTFAHYENRKYSEVEATEVFDGKVEKLIADGYVFEVYPDMNHFVTTGRWIYEVREHSASK
jgi:hypothetical protein